MDTWMFWQTLRDQMSLLKTAGQLWFVPLFLYLSGGLIKCSEGSTRPTLSDRWCHLWFWGAERRRLPAGCSSQSFRMSVLSPQSASCGDVLSHHLLFKYFFLLFSFVFSVKLKGHIVSRSWMSRNRATCSYRFLGANNLHVSGNGTGYLINFWWHFWVCVCVCERARAHGHQGPT